MSGIKIGVIGGGAAGMTAAITAARQGADVTVLEGTDRLGKKLLSTGNGKCNLGNRNLDVTAYYSREPEKLAGFLKRFGTEDAVSFFQGIGVMLKEKNGLLYPACEQASAVQDALRYELTALGVRQVTASSVKEALSMAADVPPQLAILDVMLPDGSGFALAKRLGHSLTPTVPALVQLKCRETFLKSVAGVRADAQISVLSGGECAAAERGELQITGYGLSGIPVFQVSRLVNYLLADGKEVRINVDFLPDYGSEEYERLFTSRELLLRDGRTVEAYFTGMLHKKLMMLFLRSAGLKPGDAVRDADRKALGEVFRLCRQWTLHVTGSNSYDSAQVCAGGVPLSEVTDRLESVRTPGVYFAGEILDVDGKCGGYNLHWAWCSGYLAAMAAAGEG